MKTHTTLLLDRDSAITVNLSATYHASTGPCPDESGGFEDIRATLNGREIDLSDAEYDEAEDALSEAVHQNQLP